MAQSAPIPTYDPFVAQEAFATASVEVANGTLPAARPEVPTPTLRSLTVQIPSLEPRLQATVKKAGGIRTLPTAEIAVATYTIKAGDTLESIADDLGIDASALMRENQLTAESILVTGSGIFVPAPQVGPTGSRLRILPDSELVYGPADAEFNAADFIRSQGGYLATFTEDVGSETLTGAEVVLRIAQDYSVSPRVLLALIEYRTGWLTRQAVDPETLDYPFHFMRASRPGLYYQLGWVARALNRGFYLWSANGIGGWKLKGNAYVPASPDINPGTAAIQTFFATQDTRFEWDRDVAPNGFAKVYASLFGDPFSRAIEPLVPSNLSQPSLALPFVHGERWSFTGGPHAAWDMGSAWAALDFAPADVQGCAVSQQWVTAAADGYIVRARNGQVIQDLDGDGAEQSGWDIMYMHVFSQGRVAEGTYLQVGDRIGHPSCEGGVSDAAHLHLARKYNGVWIAADGAIPFNLSGFISSGNGVEYDGFLSSGASTLEAFAGVIPGNQIVGP